MNPYLIEGPAMVSFSGGRTSAYMLRKILDVGLQPDVHVLFADTGKERRETYEFVLECAERWGATIHWVQRPGGFEQLITDRKYLPNTVTRFCTSELKVRPMKKWMTDHGYEHWTNVIGIRADERHRAARLRSGEGKDQWDYAFPLVDAGVGVSDVHAFWKAQPFDLRLQPHEGNCDLCFLKGYQKKVQVVIDHPELADWWIGQEDRMGKTFHKRFSVRQIVREANVQRLQLPLWDAPRDDDDIIDCFCGD